MNTKVRKPRSKSPPYIIMLHDQTCYYPTPDKLVATLDYPFTQEEKDFMQKHRKMDRTVLYRLLSSSASRLQMTWYMDKTFGKPPRKN